MTSIFSKLFKPFEDPRRLYELGIGTALLVLMSLFALLRSFDAFEMLFFDLHFQIRGVREVPKDVVVVGVDEASLDYVGRWPWNRDKHAKLIDLLNHNAFRPNSLFFDMLFEQKDSSFPKGDEDLIYRAEKFKSSLFMSYFFEKGVSNAYMERYERHPEKEKRLEDFALPASEEIPEHLESYDKVSLPFIELANASKLVYVNTPNDKDGRTRRAQLLAKYQGKIYPSADLLVVLNYLGVSIKEVRLTKKSIVIHSPKHGVFNIPINSHGELLINYYGGLDHVSSLSFLEALNEAKAWTQGKSAEHLKALKDKIVLVGVTALGIGDRRTTPFREYEPGVALHAQIMANILERRFLIRSSRVYSLIGLWTLGLTAIFCTMFLRISRSLPAVLGLTLIYFALTHLLFLEGHWIDFASAATTVIILFIGITSFRYFSALEELKRTQNQLIQAAKLASLGEMSAGIAHEFRNILNAVNLSAEALTRPGLPPEKVEKYGAMLKKIMGSANAILEGLLLFARQSQSVKTPGNLKACIEDTLIILEKEMIRHQIELTTDLDNVPEIPFDRGQISQVVLNMANNSRDALKDRENKKIKISLKEEPASLRMDIEDNGSGIPPQVLKRLFQPFVTSKEPGKGTGLGLSVCHGIIRSHGGDIKVTTAQNLGTTWHIYLPKV